MFLLQDQSIEIEPTLPEIDQKILTITEQNAVKCVAVFESCTTSINSATESENAEEFSKASFGVGTIFVTSEAIHITSNFNWLCDKAGDAQTTLTQPMTNLVELENVTRTSFTLSFMDELENTIEKWRFRFESYPRIAHTLQVIVKNFADPENLIFHLFPSTDHR